MVNVSNTVFDVRQLSLATSVVCHVENRLCHYRQFLNLSVFNSGALWLHAVYCASSVVRQDILLWKETRVGGLIWCINVIIAIFVKLSNRLVSLVTQKRIPARSFLETWFTHILINNKRIIAKLLNVLLPWYTIENLKFWYKILL